MINAAASLVVRGKYFETALPVLLDAEKNSTAGAYQDAIDLAIIHGYNIHQQWAMPFPKRSNCWKISPIPRWVSTRY